MLSVTLTNRLTELERLSRIVEAFVEDHRLPPELGYPINLALDEVLTNIITYAYADQDEHWITLRLSLDGDVLTAELEDDGRPFNPLDAPEPIMEGTLEERPVGGLGIHLVRRMMDQLEYRREGDRNRLVMKKTVSA